ncbi:MAG: urease accessory protein UreF [Betaproteobacteria bacterium SG8_40]|nr:MAG: urease accessory protein UreF [Betaproteobacteria bacterium SG8_40]
MNALELTRLLRLASPALPVGAFSYSQGLEWAVESGQVKDEDSAHQWIGSVLDASMARFELPMLAAFFRAWRGADFERSVTLNGEYLASRETAELRAESMQMGAALLTVLEHDGEHDANRIAPLARIDSPVFPNSFAFAAAGWKLTLRDTLASYAWSWLENQVTAAMKLVPLGQRAGQRLLSRLSVSCANAAETAIDLPLHDWSNFSPMFAIACSRHETQYTRLFRS